MESDTPMAGGLTNFEKGDNFLFIHSCIYIFFLGNCVMVGRVGAQVNLSPCVGTWFVTRTVHQMSCGLVGSSRLVELHAGWHRSSLARVFADGVGQVSVPNLIRVVVVVVVVICPV